MKKVWALFVRFEHADIFTLTNGWVFQGMITDELALKRSVNAIQKDIDATRDHEGRRTAEFKVVEL